MHPAVREGGRPWYARSGTAAALALAFGLTVAATPGEAPAHIVTEVPWHPIAASYRTMMFLGNLDPVPWEDVGAAFDEPLAAAVGTKSARQKLIELDPDDGEAMSEPITRAIETEDRHDLYAAATRALSQSVRRHLDLAAASLAEPGPAARHVEEAQALHRALDDFIRQADPEAYRELGRAWLSLSSSLGSAGLGGSGGRSADEGQFAHARATIEEYLEANFEPGRFTPRGELTPLPETVVAASAGVEVAPWLPPGSSIFDPDPLPLLVLNFEEQGIDEVDLPVVAYGDMLFDSPKVFGDPARSIGLTCSSCHPRSDVDREFFIPGISHQPAAVDVDAEFFNPVFNDHRRDSLDIPSLRGIRFTAPYGRDGRFASLREFVRNVHVNEFGGPEPTPFMLDALIAYMLEFDFLPNTKLDPQGRLTAAAATSAHRGEELFRKPFAQMDGRSCASCHVPSANFVDRLAHNIGSGEQAYANSRGIAYDTPTLLGANFTAPYFHDGSLPTLASVVGWFDEQYGLGLSEVEKADLTAYLEAVGDANQPYEVFEGEHTPFRLAWEELTTFASTLDTLLPRRDAFHAKLMIDTVAGDLAADASGMANLAAKPQVYELAVILADVGEAIERSDWDEAETLWANFKARQDEYDARMF